MKKTQQIESEIGLQATYGGGDYTVTVWAVEGQPWLGEDIMSEDHYELVFCRSNTDIAHSRQTVAAEQLETEMRKWQSDLRRWHKVIFVS